MLSRLDMGLQIQICLHAHDEIVNGSGDPEMSNWAMLAATIETKPASSTAAAKTAKLRRAER
ncbi:MAG: hypothetical protein J0H61_01195 [Alphaproteobacteria bacterium]|nr:hypothetical protein [Alphaproteobacteria bacterium]